MLIIFNKTPCSDRNESIMNETTEKWKAGGCSGSPAASRMGRPPCAAPRASSAGKRSAVKAELTGPALGSPAPRRVPLPPAASLACPRRCPFSVTQQMTSPRGVCGFLPPAFTEKKAGSPFYPHSAPVPVLVFFFFPKDRLPASLAQRYPVERALSSELTILTFCGL